MFYDIAWGTLINSSAVKGVNKDNNTSVVCFFHFTAWPRQATRHTQNPTHNTQQTTDKRQEKHSL